MICLVAKLQQNTSRLRTALIKSQALCHKVNSKSISYAGVRKGNHVTRFLLFETKYTNCHRNIRLDYTDTPEVCTPGHALYREYLYSFLNRTWCTNQNYITAWSSFKPMQPCEQVTNQQLQYLCTKFAQIPFLQFSELVERV